jgi:hypothetical protein
MKLAPIGLKTLCLPFRSSIKLSLLTSGGDQRGEQSPLGSKFLPGNREPRDPQFCILAVAVLPQFLEESDGECEARKDGGYILPLRHRRPPRLGRTT